MNLKLLLFLCVLFSFQFTNSQVLVPISSPAGYDNNTFGYNSSPIEFNGSLYLRYRKNNGNNVLFRFDGNQLTEIPSPANYDGNSAGYAISVSSFWPTLKPVVWNNKLYLGYNNNQFNTSTTLFEFDGTTLSPISNPLGFGDGQNSGGVKAMITTTTDAMYLNYEINGGGERVLFKYDGTTLVEIPSPPGYDATNDSPGIGLLDFPDNINSFFKEIPIIGNNMFLQYSGEDYSSDLTLLDLTTNQLTPYRGVGYDGVNRGFLGYPMLIDDVPYFKYINNEGLFKLVKFENNNLVTIDSPPGYSNEFSGYLGDPILYNNQLYIRAKKDNGSFQLLGFDGTQLTEIAPADAAYQQSQYGYMGDPILFNNNLYLRYYKGGDDTYRLFKLEGGSLVEISLPPNYEFFGRGYYGDPILYDNALYLNYYNFFGVYTLYKYDGSTLTEISTPTGFSNFNKGYTGEAYVAGSDLFLVYKSNTDARVLFKYNGTTLQELASPSGYETYGFIDSFHIYNNKLYMRYRHNDGQYDLMEYNGLTLGVDEVTTKQIKIYPNPVTDVFHLSDSEYDSFKTLILFDINGREVTTLHGDNGDGSYYIGHIAKGMYFLKFVYPDGTTKSLKLIKK
ncbi:T9SS type A sorting domain-containing protein [Xanthomarina sp.]|uniref:T9SS type A sorting domain-containing protein n=1 Tax=Xanthomarina sp. TaxID=1931211 RepID=UPI000C5B4A93|nr:T9SS type A sorting domain-containing protein [Xanthomarina sp.]MAL23825.1 hypothetical protein [Xanthomarina sp.]